MKMIEPIIEPIIHALISVIMLCSLAAIYAHWITFVFILIALIWIGINTTYILTHPQEYTLEEI